MDCSDDDYLEPTQTAYSPDEHDYLEPNAISAALAQIVASQPKETQVQEIPTKPLEKIDEETSIEISRKFSSKNKFIEKETSNDNGAVGGVDGDDGKTKNNNKNKSKLRFKLNRTISNQLATNILSKILLN